MTRLWLVRILRGTAASFLLGACMGGLETAFVLRGSITVMVNALQRLQLWGLNALFCGAVAALLGLVLASAFGAILGHDSETRRLAVTTARDPRHPWLPWTLGGAAAGLAFLQTLPLALGVEGRAAAVLLLGLILAASLAIGLRFLLKEVDISGRGSGVALLGLPALLLVTMSLSVSAPLAGGKGAATRAREGTPNLLLVTVDGLRADHFEERVRTPSLSWLARKGVRFEQLTTPSTSEGPPLGALLSGRHPLSTGFIADGQRLPERLPGTGQSVETVAEVLGREGYVTGAFVSTVAADGRAAGLKRGFGVFDDGINERLRGWKRLGLPTTLRWVRLAGGGVPDASSVLRPAAETLLRFEYWLAYHYRQNFFAWVQLSDPRNPFLYAEVPDEALKEPIPGARGRAYSSRVVQLDEMLGELLEALDADGILDQTLVVVTGSRGYTPGGQPTIDESWCKVAGVAYGPGLPQGTVLQAPVRLEDLAPTLLSAVGFRRARMGDGQSVLPIIQGRQGSASEALVVGPPRQDGLCPVAVRTPEWKYTRLPRGSEAWYLLDKDPRELSDRSDDRVEDLEREGRELTELLGRSLPLVRRPALDPGRSAELRGLEASR